ncbi:MAG TPA: glycosyltransferase family 39 protein [Isosphaeraceae bacterium]|jgi:4-amino-4-deoxy-L-arabinose transferase-like glycosyltransferase|nr:glycosyltransferase family 39 protein [Isosphaeraceae bacterium]
MISSLSSSQRENAAVTVLTIVGAVLRLWQFGRLGLQHFDEGIYALSSLWVLRPGGVATIEPSLIPYAPPGFPILVGLSYLALGVSDLSAIAVSAGCGIATIPVTAWLARRTFGTGAGPAAAAFAALAGPHIAFSRVALTDVPFLLAWLISLGLGVRFLERPGFGRAVGFGLAVGLAQNLKYNGWLAGAIVGIVALLDAVLRRGEKRHVEGRALAIGLAAALVAAAVYWPWYDFVERHGGYAGLLAHHRSYMGGPAAWWPHWKLQMAQATALEGGRGWGLLTWLLVVFAAGLSLLGVVPARTGRRTRISLALGLFSLGCLLEVVASLPWWVALCWAPWLLRDAHPGARVVATWWLVLSVVTPLYHPYARLWLPLLAAGWIVMGGVAAAILRHCASPTQKLSLRTLAWPVGCALLALGQAFLLEPHATPLPGLLGPTDSLRRGVEIATAHLPEAVPGLRLLVRPPVTFYLAGKVPAQVEAGLEGLLDPGDARWWALVDVAQVRAEADPTRAKARLLERWDVVQEVTTELNLPTLLDLDPAAVSGGSKNRSAPLWLMRPRRGAR